MKNILKFFGILTLIGLAAYAVYLCYIKLVKEPEQDDWDDLEDWGYEFDDEEKPISFTDRLKAAAERQLEKAK